ncbi:glutaredoxin-C9-like [Corylus avellana]|uniref:glutaredoxin-C9-like n=1 Tax=Corylus avellana TaxID=13451 RepID=UPI001E2199BB|nr:glutaredoxin-C9-like [Corylus avellana]
MQVVKKSGIGMDGSIASINGDTSDAVKLDSPYETVRQLAACNAVVVFSMSGCCMCTVAKRLLFGLGVGPVIIELDEHSAGPDIQAVLYELCPDGQKPVPAVFVGGKFLGGVETLMACHINGSLVPLLKDAGALWL